jgi:hypothetical protein
MITYIYYCESEGVNIPVEFEKFRQHFIENKNSNDDILLVSPIMDYPQHQKPTLWNFEVIVYVPELNDESVINSILSGCAEG